MPAPNLPLRSEPISAEVLEWANRQFTDEEVLEGLREIQENGGFELREFAHELDQAAGTDERPAR